MTFPQTIPIPSLYHLATAAQQLQAAIQASGQTLILFEGEMGAGKTTTIRALCQAMGVADDVSSPTFALVNEYRDARDQPIYHFDFYRIDTVEEAVNIGAQEYFDSGYLCLIEWPSRVEALLPPDRLLVTLTVIGPTERELRISNE
ncbi:tRNA (adenosine(37)-N6)-threonylcarbamoyltransferase complex ATPase subunit type 1 TsaE [Hymenobacter sp. BT175]|uniref:tRNA (adenosine(37)-N6)-threonylcarbamoyltransferase complex ATPase subunit type 1 TsaE n=1 Tax=Hymenobacter translucens TaxID=2886507 RepID=UPI001D0EB418|nr:tRNA (adenosine(37)-N6)-threonylcarbamoyltransferase complex ATPase subunit type 1 TsaE [Hymenobacter translucens]MCC2545034.1 tRNA (adenosine(37)-N6)-threonylcarbamoyltransferase complex ATPase subunit type 1 TsaE [Hymenobacter translucens]